MKKILFFETKEFTGATRVTRTLAKVTKDKYEVAFAQVGEHVKEDIESAICREHPDILFCSFILINPDVIQIGKSHNLYVIIRNDYNLSDVTSEVRRRALASYPLADELIAQTSGMKQELVQTTHIDASKIRLLDNPLDESDILEKAKAPNPYPSDGSIHFCWIGRYDWIKGVDVLIKAFRIVYKKEPQASLYLIGKTHPDSECYKEVLNCLNDFNLKNTVHVVDFANNPYVWMKNADCLVIPSRSEANSNVQKEALLLDVPIISTCKVRVETCHIHYVEPDNVRELAESMLKYIVTIKRKRI